MTSMPFWKLTPWTSFGNWFSPSPPDLAEPRTFRVGDLAAPHVHLQQTTQPMTLLFDDRLDAFAAFTRAIGLQCFRKAFRNPVPGTSLPIGASPSPPQSRSLFFWRSAARSASQADVQLTESIDALGGTAKDQALLVCRTAREDALKHVPNSPVPEARFINREI
jgi:hypothetical protein